MRKRERERGENVRRRDTNWKEGRKEGGKEGGEEGGGGGKSIICVII